MIKIGVSITVKDEYLFIKEFINYYKKIGFDKIIIFDDGSSRDFLSKIPNDKSLIIIKQNKSFDLTGVDWLENIRDQYHNNFDVRKRFNTYYACRFFKKKGYDWLFSCDVDEFIGSFEDKSKFDLKKNLKNIKVPQVLFLARDVVVNPNTKLFDNTNFRSIKQYEYWLGKFYQIVLSRLKSPLIDKIYKVIFNSIFGKKITFISIKNLNYIIPINPSYLGHKSLINLNFFDKKNFNVHYWVEPGSHRKLSYKVLGALYHFDLISSEYVYEKFKKRNDAVAFNGPAYRNIVESKAKNLSFSDFDKFYDDYINNYNKVDTIEIKQIMRTLKNDQQT